MLEAVASAFWDIPIMPRIDKTDQSITADHYKNQYICSIQLTPASWITDYIPLMNKTEIWEIPSLIVDGNSCVSMYTYRFSSLYNRVFEQWECLEISRGERSIYVRTELPINRGACEQSRRFLSPSSDSGRWRWPITSGDAKWISEVSRY